MVCWARAGERENKQHSTVAKRVWGIFIESEVTAEPAQRSQYIKFIEVQS